MKQWISIHRSKVGTIAGSKPPGPPMPGIPMPHVLQNRSRVGVENGALFADISVLYVWFIHIYNIYVYIYIIHTNIHHILIIFCDISEVNDIIIFTPEFFSKPLAFYLQNSSSFTPPPVPTPAFCPGYWGAPIPPIPPMPPMPPIICIAACHWTSFKVSQRFKWLGSDSDVNFDMMACWSIFPSLDH